MRDSLMYRLCYYRFGEVRTRHDQPSGFDTVRNAEIGLKHFDLKYFREAYSSERWIVRIYEVLPLPNREERTKSRFDLKKNNSFYQKLIMSFKFFFLLPTFRPKDKTNPKLQNQTG